jgi:AcrR family transcriptional regulator
MTGDAPIRDKAAAATGNATQAERSERTRTALLNAAEVVFARDGFEASRIEDIAAEAGRSRGAFYANFDSKVEVFLALRTLAMRRRAAELRARLEPIPVSGSDGMDARWDAVIAYVLEQVCDTRSLLLQIEFKLFALRHPELLGDLAEKHLEASTSINKRELSELISKTEETIEESRVVSLAMEAVLEGFALNAMFAPGVLDGERLTEVVPGLVERILKRS